MELVNWPAGHGPGRSQIKEVEDGDIRGKMRLTHSKPVAMRWSVT